MKTLIQIGAGPNGLIQAIKILEKHEGKVQFFIYDKRRFEELKNLTALVFLKKSSIDQLDPTVVDELLTPDPITHRPMAYRAVDGFFKEDVIPLYIADLQRVLIKHLKNKFGVDIHREHELVDLEKTGEIKRAVFHVPDGDGFNEVKVEYDLCTLSFGSKAAKDFNISLNYKLFHQTPVILARFPLKRNYANIASLDKRVDKTLMQVFPIDAEETYFGLMVTPDQVGFFATTSWETARDYKVNPQNRMSRINELLTVVQKACPEITEAIGNGAPTYTDVILAEKSLCDSHIVDYAVMTTGDALTVSPWVFGNELNHSLSYLLKVYLTSVDKMIDAKNPAEVKSVLQEYGRETDRKINHPANVPFNMLVDPYGHTRTPDGYKVALHPMVRPRLMPEGIEEHLPTGDSGCGNTAVIKPYVTWLGIKMGNMVSGTTPPSIAPATNRTF
jgi:hypothetical protein